MGTGWENIVPENLCIRWKHNETRPLKGFDNFLTALKAFKTQKGLHHTLTTLGVFNKEKSTSY